MNKKAVPTAAAVRELAILTGAVAIIAAAVYFFLVPSHASVSSISGLGIVLANFVPLPLSAITYGDLSSYPYNQLSPCTTCGAPERPEVVAAWNSVIDEAYDE